MSEGRFRVMVEKRPIMDCDACDGYTTRLVVFRRATRAGDVHVSICRRCLLEALEQIDEGREG